jgi:hypothetical protein
VFVRLGAAAVLALLLGAGIVAWPELWPAAPDQSVRLVNGRLTGDMFAYVVRVNREDRTVAVSQSAFGWHPVVLAVNRDTLITVEEREGGLGDLLKDVAVRVVYEIEGDRRLARAIHVGGGREAWTPSVRRPAPAAPVPAAQALETAGGGGTRPARTDMPATARVNTLRVDTPRAEAPGPGTPRAETPRAAAPRADAPRAETPRQETPRSDTPRVATPRADTPRVETLHVETPRVETSRVETPRGDAARQGRASAPVEELPRPAADGDAADGSAAIDWLINSAGRR